MKRSIIAVLIVGMWSVACGSDGDHEPEGITERDAALRIMVDVEEGSDVASAKMTVSTCGDDTIVASRSAAIEDWMHEGLQPSYRRGENHLFWEYYAQVVPGCYDVEVVLRRADGTPSQVCTAAVGKEISVASDQTREVLLYSRCDGIDEGPVVEMVAFDTTAFVGCDQPVEACATVRYVGNTNAAWRHHGGMPLSSAHELKSPGDKVGERAVHCARFSPRYHGETIAQLTATPAWAETIDEGHAVLFAEKHQVLFGMYVECPDERFDDGGDDRRPAVSVPPELRWENKRFGDFAKWPKILTPPGFGGDRETPGVEARAALNHPPEIKALEYDPSKFLSCPAAVTICADATDRDGDAVGFSWEQHSGPQIVSDPQLVSSAQSGDSARECMHYELPDTGASYEFEVTAYDYVAGPDGKLMTVEQWISGRHGRAVQSRDTLRFPVHVGCDAP